MPPLLGEKISAAVWYEFGSAFDDWDQRDVFHSVSVGGFMETILGPILIGGSFAEQGRSNFYFAIGPVFLNKVYDGGTMRNLSEQDTVEFFLPVSSFDIETPRAFSSEVRIDFGAVTDQGRVRSNNEDAFLIFRTGRYWQKLMTNVQENLLPERHEENGYAMAVADGMGGA